MGEKQITGGLALMPVKKLNGARLRMPSALNGRDECDRPRHDGADHELVDVAGIALGGVDDHFRETGSSPLAAIQLIQYSFHSTASPAGSTWIGFRPSSITAYSSVCVFFF